MKSSVDELSANLFHDITYFNNFLDLVPAKFLHEEYNNDEKKNITMAQALNEGITLNSIATMTEEDLIKEDIKQKLREKLTALQKKRKLSIDENGGQPSKKQKLNDAKAKNINNKQKNNKQKFHEDELDNLNNSLNNNKKFNNNNKAQNRKQSEEDLEYATFDLTGDSPVPAYLNKNKKLSKQELLKRAEEKKKKAEEIEKSLKGTEEGTKYVQDVAWNKMLSKAKGEKEVDIKKLKNSIKRNQAKKEKSAKEWKERLDSVKSSKEERQKKRKDNIEARKKKIRDKRSGKVVKTKKPKSRPGFEGKKNKEGANGGKKNFKDNKKSNKK